MAIAMVSYDNTISAGLLLDATWSSIWHKRMPQRVPWTGIFALSASGAPASVPIARNPAPQDVSFAEISTFLQKPPRRFHFIYDYITESTQSCPGTHSADHTVADPSIQVAQRIIP